MTESAVRSFAQKEQSAYSLIAVGVKNSLSKIPTGQLLLCTQGAWRHLHSHHLSPYKLICVCSVGGIKKNPNNINKQRFHPGDMDIHFHQHMSLIQTHKRRIKILTDFIVCAEFTLSLTCQGKNSLPETFSNHLLKSI